MPNDFFHVVLTSGIIKLEILGGTKTEKVESFVQIVK